jgi:hypothetical protein
MAIAATAVVAIVVVVLVLSRHMPESGQAAKGLPAYSLDVAKVSSSALTVYCFDKRQQLISQGSGFVVRDSGVAVTNWHVTRKAFSVVATNVTGETFAVSRYINIDPANDLVLMQLVGERNSAVVLPAVRIADSRLVAAGQRIYTVSAPRGLPQSFSDGLLSAIRSINGQQLLQITAPISPGSSGGPVFNQEGEVVGVIREQLTSGQNLNFAVPIDAVVRLLNTPGPLVEDHPTTSVPECRKPVNVEDPFDSGISALNAKDYGDAAKVFAAISRREPQNAAASYNAALAYVGLGEFGRATDYFQHYIAVAEPGDEDIAVAKQWLSTYASALKQVTDGTSTPSVESSDAAPSATPTHTESDEADTNPLVVMVHEGTIYHRPECAMVQGVEVTSFRLAQVADWAKPCIYCKPPSVNIR